MWISLVVKTAVPSLFKCAEESECPPLPAVCKEGPAVPLHPLGVPGCWRVASRIVTVAGAVLTLDPPCPSLWAFRPAPGCLAGEAKLHWAAFVLSVDRYSAL